MRRLLIGGIILLIIVLAGTGYIIISSQSKISQPDQLSTRSKEFMKSQKLSDSSLWRNVVLDQKAAVTNQEIYLDKCFKLRVPFVIKNVASEGECTGTITLSKGGVVAIGKRQVGFSDLTESPDIKLRMTNPDIYKEVSTSGKLSKFKIYAGTSSGYERVAFLLQNATYLTVSLVTSTNENLDTEYFNLLNSIELL